MDKTIKNAREYSFHVLSEVLINEKLLNNEINKVFDLYSIKDEDKSFIKKECTGIIENINNIDSIIDKYSKVKASKLKKEILIVFRLSIYEMLYMDKVPEYATINESVNIIKKTKCKGLAGYVNATLKNIAKNELNKTQDEIPSKKEDKHCYFKILNKKDQEVTNELNGLKIAFSKYDGALEFKHSSVYYVDKYKYVLDTDAFKNGNIIIQDVSSAYLVDRLYDYIESLYKNYQYKLSVLDTCSAPGGKIISLYTLLNNKYRDNYFEARDVSNDKIDKIKENVKRLNIDNIKMDVHDATVYTDEDFEKFDVVLCDVPCSGLGVISKKPDIKLKTSDEKINSLKHLQTSIIETSKRYVKNGGILSYSTCTTTKVENEENIADFLNKNSNFEKMYEKRIENNDENKSDGFYMCFLRKR